MPRGPKGEKRPADVNAAVMRAEALSVRGAGQPLSGP